jgi:hypothetical protein
MDAAAEFDASSGKRQGCGKAGQNSAQTYGTGGATMLLHQ